MRVLHAAFQAVETGAYGILSQMEGEQAAAMTVGLDWHVRFFCPRGIFEESPIVIHADCKRRRSSSSPLGRVESWISLRRSFYHWLLKQEDNYDVLLVRHGAFNPYHTRFIVGRKIPVFSVHHTLENESYNYGKRPLRYLRKSVEAVVGPPAIRACEGVLGVTQEIVDYELCRARCPDKPAFVYPNGINFSEYCEDRRRDGRVELLFISSYFSPWRGLDLLLNTVHESRRDFVVHLVGGVPDLEREAAEDDSRVKLHGHLSRRQIRHLAARCALGLSSFAMHRKNMAEASALKVREYLMLGLPVYAGHKDVFPDTFRYFKKGPCDIEVILEFAQEHMSSHRCEVAKSARPYIEKTELLRSLHNFLFEHFEVKTVNQ